MPVSPHILKSPAALGIDESTRPELVEFGTKNLRQENVRPVRTGEAVTRFGFEALSNAGVNSVNGRRIFADRSTIVRISTWTDGTTSSEVFDLNGGQWSALMGRPSECAVRLIDMPSLGTGTHIEDVAYANGYFCVVWSVDSATLLYSFASVINAVTGAVVSAPIQIGSVTASNAGPCLVVVGTAFIHVRANPAGSTIQAHYLDTVNSAAIVNGWTAITDLATNQSGTNTAIAVCSLPHATLARAALVYVNDSGGASAATVKTFDTTGVLETQTLNTNSVNPTILDIRGNALDTLWVSWDEALLVQLCGLPPLAITTTPLATTATIITAATEVNLIAIQPSDTAGQGRLFVNDTSSSLRSAMRGFQTTAGAAATNGSQISAYAAHACGRPFLNSGRYYIPVFVADSANTQKQVVLAEWSDDVTFFRPVANPAPALSTLNVHGESHYRCTIIAGPDAGKYYFGLGILRSSVADATALVEFDFTSIQRWQSAAWGNSTYLSGGLLQYLDGRRVAEVGFLVRPPTPTTATSGTGITATTGWRYICVYEEVDADGNWHISGLSDPSASTGAVTNKTVTVTTRPLTVSSRLSSASAQATSVRVAFYRTLDGGVAPYYRLGTTINNTASATVTYADTTTDATLAAAAKLYAQPGVLGTAQDRRPPPYFQCLVSYNGMLVGASGSDIWYSGQNVAGEGAWFNPVFQVPVPGDGDITALAVMDGALFAFKRAEIYVLAGDPPSDNGASGGLGVPRRLSTDLGTDSNITCTTAIGIVFKSERGIELLTRKQVVTWIGQGVSKTTDDYPVVTSMTVESSPSGAYLLVELASAVTAGLVTGTGRTLVLDLSSGDWVSIDRRKSVAGASDAPSQSACMVYNGTAWRYAWMSTTGRVHIEDRTTYKDADGSFVTPLIETGWFNAAQNEQRVWRTSVLFERATAAGLSVETAYDLDDYDPSAIVSTWDEDETDGQRQLELDPEPRGESLKFRITTTAPTTLGTGQGLILYGLALNLQPKQGPTKGTVRLDPALRK